ncbi:MAG: transglutaminaseTgpA domain-containing protein, partial [Acidobacteriota bacterium]
MTQRRRDLEALLLTMFAAVPLYATHAVGLVPLVLFHTAMLVIVVRVSAGRTPEFLPSSLMRSFAVAYVIFYVVDAALLSRNAIAASTHLVLFIAVYQPVESMRTNNRAQRLLTAALIAVAGIATSTHISILLFILGFVFMMFRQMMHISHVETEQSIGRDYAEPASSRTAAFYLVGAGLVGALLFPILPRVRNPFVQGMAGALNNATTGLSDSIDFNRERQSSPDSGVVARVWMGREVMPFFTPL